MTIVEFIEARIAEDEETAKYSGGDSWTDDDRFNRVDVTEGYIETSHHGAHIARHDPARVLRQCAAIRELVKIASDVEAMYSIPAEDAADSIRKTIAAIWSDHPDYQQEWSIGVGA